MIYLDTSVALAHLLAEDREPPVRIWRDTVVASRLLEYELWNRLHARGLATSHGDLARDLLNRVAFVELNSAALARALDSFPIPVRTLDALHLASIEFLRARDQRVELATYDTRMAMVAKRMRIPLYDLR